MPGPLNLLRGAGNFGKIDQQAGNMKFTAKDKKRISTSILTYRARGGAVF
jgi:hypothetical protein